MSVRAAIRYCRAPLPPNRGSPRMTLPEKMTAIEIAAPGGPDALVPVERPVPRPGPGEVLVQVAAAGVNRPDVMQREGNYPPPSGASDIPGLEIAGEVVEAGPGAGGVPDRVCALVQGGGYAEYCLAAAPLCLPVPEGHERRAGGGASGDVLHGVDERVRARAARGRREHPRARGEQRHRHHRHPARAGVRSDGLRHRRHAREVPRVRGAGCGRVPSTTGRTTSSPGSRRRPKGAGSTWCSTWWGATTSRGPSSVSRPRAGSSRSPPSAGSRARSTCSRSW